MSDIEFSREVKPAPAKVFFVGIGGIGMSGLAQFMVKLGYCVAGSDRGLGDLSKAQLYKALREQGISLYPQDGSGVLKFQPDFLVASAAVESGNPDLLAIPEVPVVHRARALSFCIDSLGVHRISVAGSCGKTTVTGWIASALRQLGYRIAMINGGYTVEFANESDPGNFYMDEQPQYVVAEVDESDKSIREFSQETAVLLNIGNDHYDKDELGRVFSDFLSRTSGTCVVCDDIVDLVHCGAGKVSFGMPEGYSATSDGIRFDAGEFGEGSSHQWGRHSALNAMAVMQALATVCPQKNKAEICQATSVFRGVLQRFEMMGKLPQSNCVVVNDYAHNPEKIAAAIEAAHERFGKPLVIAFQPHGFTPLQFMREELTSVLKKKLHSSDRFLFLPVYYAGGTAAFSPTSDEVASAVGMKNVISVGSRADTLKLVSSEVKAFLVLGARDPSLRSWCLELTKA